MSQNEPFSPKRLPPVRPAVARLQDHNSSCHITIVRSGGLGDTILLLPTLSLLRQAIPRSHITLVGSTWARQLLPLLHEKPNFALFDSAELTPLFIPNAPADPLGVFAEADLVIIYTSCKDNALLRNAHNLSNGEVVSWPVDPPGDIHTACHLATALFKKCPTCRDIPVPALRPCSGPDRAEDHQVPMVAVHPGRGGQSKVWPNGKFAQLIEELLEKDIRVFMPEGPADSSFCSNLRKNLPATDGLVDPGKLSLSECAARMSSCAAYVGSDSGLTHLAAALGVPTIAVFGPTDPSVWRPLGAHVEVVHERARNTFEWPAVRSVSHRVKAVLSIETAGHRRDA